MTAPDTGESPRSTGASEKFFSSIEDYYPPRLKQTGTPPDTVYVAQLDELNSPGECRAARPEPLAVGTDVVVAAVGDGFGGCVCPVGEEGSRVNSGRR